MSAANQTPDPSDGTPKTAFGRYMATVFGIDLRSLALFRIVLGSVLITDLVMRFDSLRACYTDDGFANRQLIKDFFPHGFWSFHLIDGSESFQLMLFAIAGAAALLLALGCFTRVATIICWLMVVSLHVRNPILLNSGDSLLRAMLFWSIFLPMGRIWSIDALVAKWRRKAPAPVRPKAIVSAATAAIILQLLIMYWFTGIAKCNQDWVSGQALGYVLHMDMFIKPFGKQLLEMGWIIKPMTWWTLVLELVGPTLLLLPWKNAYLRLFNIASFFALHIGIGFAISVGLFSVISMTGWLVLIPTLFWDSRPMQALGRLLTFRRSGGGQDAADVSRPAVQVVPRRYPSRAVLNAFCVFTLAYVLVWNLYNIEQLKESNSPLLRNSYLALEKGLKIELYRLPNGAVVTPEWYGRTTMLAQEFEMFGPAPRTNHWFVYKARLENGDLVDLLHGGPANLERPPDMRNTLPDHRWRKAHRNLMLSDYYAMYRQPMAEYQCRIWNEKHHGDKRVLKMDFLGFSETLYPDRESDGFVEYNLGFVYLGELEEERGPFADLLRGGDILP